MESEYTKYEPIFGAWKIAKLIGEGSYGKVYEIEREDFAGKYKAALKAITIPRSQSEVKNYIADGMDEESASTYFRSFVEEMTKEFVLMDKLKGNSYIVNYEDHTVIEHQGEIGWDVLIRMELLTPLNDYLKDHQLSCQDVAKVGFDLSNALEICDKYDIIHRDIKPDNIFVSDLGNYKLGDFGIARVAEKTTGASTKIGTNSYMAPEVVRGENYDERVDIYSLGLVLYRLLNNNRLPFLPPAPAAVTYTQREEANAKRIRGESLPAPANADERLTEIIMKATAADKDRRYRSASELKADLESYLGLKTSIEPTQENVIKPADTQADKDLDTHEDYDKTVAIPIPKNVVEELPEATVDRTLTIEADEIPEKTKTSQTKTSPKKNIMEELFTFLPFKQGIIALAGSIVLSVIAAAILGGSKPQNQYLMQLNMTGGKIFVIVLLTIVCASLVTALGSFIWGVIASVADPLILMFVYLLVFKSKYVGYDGNVMGFLIKDWYHIRAFPMVLIPILALIITCVIGVVKFIISSKIKD